VPPGYQRVVSVKTQQICGLGKMTCISQRVVCGSTVEAVSAANGRPNSDDVYEIK
jgi:hypothetical protein